MKKQTMGWKAWVGKAALATALALGSASCGAALESDPMSGPDDDSGEPSELRSLSDAEEALMNHDLDLARAIYQERLLHNPAEGESAAGRALCDMLLIPGMPEVKRLLIESLGAQSGLDAAEVIYGEEGFLYWASRGARWADDGQFMGIRSLLADDLPWTRRELESAQVFVEGLNEPGDTLARHLVSVANALNGLDQQLQVAIDDPNFVRLYVPGELFHDPSLSLTLGRAELATMQAFIQVVRATFYALGAYEHSWTLEDALGAWRQEVHLDDARYVAGFLPVDYSVAYLDARLFRRVAQPDRLQAARTALKDALSRSRDALRLGLTAEVSTTLEWQEPSVESIQRIDALFNALAAALDGPTLLPHSEPEVTLDLSSFFTTGRTLPVEIPWMRRTLVPEPLDPAVTFSWELNPEATEVFFRKNVVQGIAAEQEFTIDLGDEGASGFIEALAGTYLDAIQDVYLVTR
ncbi:hypothetical protein DL240_14215 [Lujinxingia litoralis]|uniref:Uncharacterized protein n=1 Tax=Lujinxingia litoralis TaxID=2211119 RepID=A0A328C800_9DELT|nr:hypothetical protein [Lujinxingia litoralis]RAL21275.1 hypothetical protein DL240_14215 [Lujinxingia litoralis]